MSIIELAFEKATGIPNAWTNPALMQARNGFVQGWELAVAHEREACAKLLETTDLGGLKDNPAMQSWVAEMLLAYVKAIRARGTT